MSRGFKDQISLWMSDNVGKKFDGIQDLDNQCALSVDCSSVTSHRIIQQLSAKNGLFLILFNEDDNVKIARHRQRN